MGYLAPVPRPLYLELRPRLPAPINVSTSSTSYLKFSHYDHATSLLMFTGYLNHIDLLMSHVHVLKKLSYCVMCT